MPFKQIFERRVNSDMQSSNGGSQAAVANEEADAEKRRSTPVLDPEADDVEYSEKKDQPPRFSTLFGVAPPQPPVFESYPHPKRNSGIDMPLPLFVVFAVILLFIESTLLFAYTVIGLYNNLPTQLVPSTAALCNCDNNRHPAINIAPNFVMPQAQALVTQTVTVARDGPLGDTLPTISTISSSSTTSLISGSKSSTSSIGTSTPGAAIASDLLGLFGSLALPSSMTTTTSSSSTKVVTADPGAATSTLILSEIPPPRSTVNSVQLITVDASGSTLQPQSTVTSTAVFDASQAAAVAQFSAAAESSIQAAMSSISAALVAKPIVPSSTTFLTSITSTSTPLPPPPATAAPPPPASVIPPSPTTSTRTTLPCMPGNPLDNFCA